MSNSTCGIANPGGSPCAKPKGHDGGHDLAAYGSLTNIPILDDDAVGEIEARATSASPNYVVDWSKGEHALLQASGWRPPHEEQPRTIATFDKDDGYLDLLFCAEARADIPALCQTVRALRAKHEWLRSKIAWHRDGVGPDVPVLQERYDKLIAQRNDLRSQLEQVTRERDDMRQRILELETEIDTKRRYL